MSWIEFSVEVDAEAVEPVSELLAQYGYNGGVVVDQPIVPGKDGPEYTVDSSRPVTLRTYLPADAQAEEARARIEQALWHLGRLRSVGPLRVATLEEQDWANAWKQHYSIQRLGRRTVIVPSWLEYQPQPDDLVLRLDPGMAFGTGLHPTTQLCIGFLEDYVKPDDIVLDLGSGSGILALVAALAGAGRVLALDTDPVAVEASRQNAAINGLADRISAAEGSLGRGALLGHWLRGVPDSLPEAPAGFTSADEPIPQCDLIVANIIAKVLVMLAPDIAEALRPGGTLISSGIIAEREDEVALAFAASGLTRLARLQQGDWVALVHQKTPEA